MKLIAGIVDDLSTEELEYLYGHVLRYDRPAWKHIWWDKDDWEWNTRGNQRETRCLSVVRHRAAAYDCIVHFPLEVCSEQGYFYVDWRNDVGTLLRAFDQHLGIAVAKAVVAAKYGSPVDTIPEGYPEDMALANAQKPDEEKPKRRRRIRRRR